MIKKTTAWLKKLLHDATRESSIETQFNDATAKHKYTWLLIASIGILTLHLFHTFSKFTWLSSDWGKFFDDLSKELGFAGLVSYILIVSVEKFSKDRQRIEIQEQIEEIKTNLFEAIFKHKVPNGVVNEISTTLFSSQICRYDLNLHYTLETIPVVNSLVSKNVKVSLQTVYILENLGFQKIRHSIKSHIEFPMLESLNELCEISSLKIFRTLDNPGISEDLISVPIKTPNSDCTAIELPPNIYVDIEAGAKIKVHLCAVLVKNLYDTEIWSTMLPTENCTLTVQVPKGDLKVRAVAYNSKKLMPVIETSTSSSWELRGGMFPYQSVALWWRPTHPEATVVVNETPNETL